ncbi:MAG: hypothetical protein ABSF25_24210, partial [Bryobacteraceae bacterium]
GKGHVATILLDIDYPELKQPLNQFNGLRLNREGAWHLVKSFNKLSDRVIKDQVLERTFDRFWDDLDNAYSLQFPDSHKAARNAEPLHIVPPPSEAVFGAPVPAKRRKRIVKQEEKALPGLFNGENPA